MQTHPIFSRIVMHCDNELAEILRTGIKLRKTIHEWPLSCVQEVQLEDGTKLIYKSQLPPTVEAGFYENASSRLLSGHRYLGRFDYCDIMVIEWIDEPLLCDRTLSDAVFIEHGKKVIEQIGQIGGNLPFHLDIGSAGAWLGIVQAVLEKLASLILDGRFSRINLSQVGRISAWAGSNEVIERVTSNPRVIHGDLKAGHVFTAKDGYRVIDWQRPLIAPPEVDLVSLLVERGLDPLHFIDPMTVGIYWFLRLCWAVESQFDLFPVSRQPLFEQWALEACTHIL